VHHLQSEADNIVIKKSSSQVIQFIFQICRSLLKEEAT